MHIPKMSWVLSVKEAKWSHNKSTWSLWRIDENIFFFLQSWKPFLSLTKGFLQATFDNQNLSQYITSRLPWPPCPPYSDHGKKKKKKPITGSSQHSTTPVFETYDDWYSEADRMDKEARVYSPDSNWKQFFSWKQNRTTYSSLLYSRDLIVNG